MERLFNRASACLAATLALALPASAVTTTGYEDFGDTAGVVLWRGTVDNFHASTVIDVASDGSLGSEYAMTADQTATSWQRFASNQSAYASPGKVLVYDSAGTGDGYKYNPNCTFGPLSFGGMWVKTLAINGLPFSIIGSGDRKTEFGASGKSTLFKFDASYTINRTGTTTFFGDATVDIANDATFTAQANSSHVVAVDSAATLKLKGAGTLAVTTMNVAGTLDLSATTVPTISGNVAFAGNATLVLPAGTNPTTEAPLTVCSGTLSAAGVVYVKVGDAEPVEAELTISGGAITKITTGIQTEQTFTSDYPSVVPAGYTYTYEATEAVTIPAVTVNGTLKTSGPITITDFDIANGADFEVVAGNTTVNCSADCKLKGNIKVDAGATLTNTRTDSLSYNHSMTVDIYGTLAMGTTRWSVPGGCTFKLHAGAQVTGAGDSLASLDFINGANRGLDVYAGEGTGSVTIEGKMRVRANETRIWIAENTTLVLASGIADGVGHHAGFKQVGPGTLEIHANSVGLSGNDSIMTQGALRLVDTTLAFPVALQGDSSYLEVVATEATTTVPVNVTSIANNNVTFSGAGNVSGSIAKTSAPGGDLATALQSSAWTGTFVADWAGAKGTQFDINSYGNANSVVEVKQLAGGYVSGSNANVTVLPTVNVSGTMTLNNGYSGKTTTFTTLTGTGTVSFASYTCNITTLDNFTGVLTPTDTVGTKIGTINLAAAPANGAKIVSLGSGAKINSLATTKVAVAGVVDPTMTLEQKADGIYVDTSAKYAYIDFAGVTNYYTTVSSAIAAASADKKVVYLIDDPDAADTYSISAGETVRIAKGGFSYDGIVFPEGEEYNTSVTEVGGITLYSCALYTATITYPNGSKESSSASLDQLLFSIYQTYTPAKAGTLVKAYDADVAAALANSEVIAALYTYDSATHTFTLKTMVAAVSFEQGGVQQTQYVPDVSLVLQSAMQYDVTATLLVDLDMSAWESGLIIPGSVEYNEQTVDLHAITLDLGGKTITGPANGYVLVNAGNTVNITGTGTVSGAGIISNATAAAVTTVSNGTFSATGDLFAAEEGSELTVYGGTFNKEFDDSYLAEGLEFYGGNGTYGVREAKGWIYEMAGYKEYTGTWSNDITYDATTGKARIESDNTYTAERPSAGQMVTITATMSFDAINEVDDEIDGAKAAVRLGAGANEGEYVFQLYTANGSGGTTWVDAVATGVNPTTGVDYTFTFVLDMTNRTYTVSVGEASLAADGNATFAFAAANATDYVQSVELTGSGSFTSLIGSYEDAPTGFVDGQTIESVTLTAAQAAWLNGQNNYAALSVKLASMSQSDLDTAYLLNLNVLDENYDGTYAFTVTDIRFDTDGQNEMVVVTVSLTRNGALDGGINGTLSLKGGTELGTDFTVLESVTIVDADFSEGNSTTCTFQKGAAAAKFYQAVIE